MRRRRRLPRRKAASVATTLETTPQVSDARWRGDVRRFYERGAADYCRTTALIDMEAQREPFLAQLPMCGRVLDLGCGSGRDLRAFRAAGYAAVGLDASEAIAAWAEAHSGADVVVADLRANPAPNETYDGVWASASLLHVRRHDLPAALREVWRVMKPGAVAFISMKRGYGEATDADGRWFTYVMDAEWSALLAAAGFVDINLQPSEMDSVWVSGVARRHTSEA